MITRIIIAGSRNFKDYDLLKEIVDSVIVKVYSDDEITIISGTARGADQLGEKYAKENSLPVERFPADWERYGKKAGFIRNYQMANNADVLIAFWDGTSKGTKMMIDLAKKKGLKVGVVNYL